MITETDATFLGALVISTALAVFRFVSPLLIRLFFYAFKNPEKVEMWYQYFYRLRRNIALRKSPLMLTQALERKKMQNYKLIQPETIVKAFQVSNVTVTTTDGEQVNLPYNIGKFYVYESGESELPTLYDANDFNEKYKAI